jgi:hypothetical protein
MYRIMCISLSLKKLIFILAAGMALGLHYNNTNSGGFILGDFVLITCYYIIKSEFKHEQREYYYQSRVASSAKQTILYFLYKYKRKIDLKKMQDQPILTEVIVKEPPTALSLKKEISSFLP